MRMRMLGMLAGILVLAGCGSVTVTEPVGAAPAKLDAAKINGTWVWENGAVTVRVTDADAGKLAGAWVQDEDSTLTMHTISGFARQVGDLTYLTLVPPKEDNDVPAGRLLYFGAVQVEGDQGTLWYPDWKAIGARIKSGALPGKVNSSGDQVDLDKLSAKQQDALTSVGSLLWTRPFPIKRVGH